MERFEREIKITGSMMLCVMYDFPDIDMVFLDLSKAFDEVNHRLLQCGFFKNFQEFEDGLRPS